MRTTVSIPLHASARWVDQVVANLGALAPVARLVVSDATGVDDALDRIRRAVPDIGPEVIWLGPRDLPGGWVAHCNDLLTRVTTPYAMWLPHDDEVGPDWVQEAEAALDADTGAVVACGRVVSIDDDADPEVESPGVELLPPTDLADADVAARLAAALRHVMRPEPERLGALFRSVVRSDAVPPLPTADADGVWADVLWALSVLASGHLAPTAATYRKRWHARSAHRSWPDLYDDERLRLELLPEALRSAPPEAQVSALAHGWEEDRRRIHDQQVALAVSRSRAAAAREAALVDEVERLRGRTL